MSYDSVITVEEFQRELDRADDIWSAYDVFEETRSGVPLQELVAEAVAGLYVDPSGPSSIDDFKSATRESVYETVMNDELVPSEIPRDIRHQFGKDLAKEVATYAVQVTEKVTEADSVTDSEINTIVAEIVPESH